MAFEEKKYDSEDHFDYALRERDQKKIHISDVLPEENGKQGYRCLGANCGNELIAVSIRKNPKHKPYFKHAPVNFNKSEKGCVFSNRQYRENLASSILTRLKKVKVPSVYKVNPENSNEYKLIEESYYIHAHRVQSQVTFYENEKGEIINGKNPSIDKRFIIKIPDVVFFNKDNKPILFIDFVDGNKQEDDKIADLYRIGVNTIQINVPKTSEEDIEKGFHIIKNTKWVYNEKEANTDYLQIPESNYKRVLESDELENRLFKESYSCRVFRIKDLIRGVGLCLESESYREAESYINNEISRVNRIREEAEQRLGNLEESYRRDAFERNRGDETEEDSKYRELEIRYLRKASELEEVGWSVENQQRINTSIRKSIQDNEREFGRINKSRRDLEQKDLDFEADIEKTVSKEFSELIKAKRDEIENIERRIGTLDEEIRTSIDREYIATTTNIEKLGIRYGNVERSVFEEFREEINFTESEIERIECEKVGIEDTIFREFEGSIRSEESEIERIREEEENIEESVRGEFDKEINGPPSQFTEGIKTILERERVLNDFISAKSDEERYKRAREFFNKKTW